MNDLTLALDIDGNKVCILQYADDIVIMAETQQELQTLLEIVPTWCNANSVQVNLEKKKKKQTNVIHFRNASAPRSDFNF